MCKALGLGSFKFIGTVVEAENAVNYFTQYLNSLTKWNTTAQLKAVKRSTHFASLQLG